MHWIPHFAAINAAICCPSLTPLTKIPQVLIIIRRILYSPSSYVNHHVNHHQILRQGLIKLRSRTDSILGLTLNLTDGKMEKQLIKGCQNLIVHILVLKVGLAAVCRYQQSRHLMPHLIESKIMLGLVLWTKEHSHEY